MGPPEEVRPVCLDTLQQREDLLLDLHHQDGRHAPHLGDLVLVDAVEHLVVQRENVLQLVIRNARLVEIFQFRLNSNCHLTLEAVM